MIKILGNSADRQQATKMAEALVLGNVEQVERRKRLAERIDHKGKEILESGAQWEDNIFKFSHPYETLSDEELRFIDEHINEWKGKVSAQPSPAANRSLPLGQFPGCPRT